jgi:transcriptional regulator of aromatic amino acid metabolism
VTPIVIQLEPTEEAPWTAVLRLKPEPALRPDAEGKMWLRSLTSTGYRSNVLVHCSRIDIVAAAAQMASLCMQPFRLCLTSGHMDLPERGSGGTLIIGDVSTLSIERQIALYDWMDDREQAMQVISITSVPLAPLVRSGRFLEGLFYRLNVLSVAVVGPSR